jgi:ATP phosphoribosyltransferase
MKNRMKTEAGKAYKEEDKKAEKLLKKYRGKTEEESGEHISVSGPIKSCTDVKWLCSRRRKCTEKHKKMTVNLMSFLKTSSEKSESVSGRLYESILNS